VKASLQLRMGQGLSMTPQLQQAIRLLQLSSLELQTEIQEALETNPLLEETEETDANEVGNPLDQEENTTDTTSQELNQLDENNIPDELPVDSQWEDTFDNVPINVLPQQATNNIEFENPDNNGDSLQAHLLWQMQLTPFSEIETAIATAIIDAIDDDGYFKSSLEEIQQSLSTEEEPVETDEIEAVLHRIQHFDPIGIAARDLRECLLLQLDLYDQNTSQLTLVKRLVDSHLDLLGKRDYAKIRRDLKVSEEELKALIQFIQLLNPRPGNQIQLDKTEYIVPDVYVKKILEQWVVSLNPDNTPRLQIAERYASLIQRADNSSENTYLKNNLQEARWFLKSLQSRNETMLKVTKAITERQQDFLDHGDEAMHPLVLHDIAETVEMHESTISRVTTRKYLHTPRGIYELKYFFSSHVSTESGGECSATAIRAIIKKLIAEENTRKPLSDNKIAVVLGEQGIKVARRTIAKYRESLAIPPSNERKRLV